MKSLVTTLLLASISWGGTYDPFLLDTQLSLLPKIALLEKNFLASTNNSPIKILIAHDRKDEDTAASCIKILISKFNGSINGRPIIITNASFDKLDDSTGYQFIYVLKANSLQINKVQNIAKMYNAFTAIYDADKLVDNGMLLSVRMERTPIILMNAKELRNSRFSFPESLLEISRIIQ